MQFENSSNSVKEVSELEIYSNKFNIMLIYRGLKFTQVRFFLLADFRCKPRFEQNLNSRFVQILFKFCSKIVRETPIYSYTPIYYKPPKFQLSGQSHGSVQNLFKYRKCGDNIVFLPILKSSKKVR